MSLLALVFAVYWSATFWSRHGRRKATQQSPLVLWRGFGVSGPGHSTLHFLASSATHCLSVTSVGWVVVEKLKTNRHAKIPLIRICLGILNARNTRASSYINPCPPVLSIFPLTLSWQSPVVVTMRLGLHLSAKGIMFACNPCPTALKDR